MITDFLMINESLPFSQCIHYLTFYTLYKSKRFQHMGFCFTQLTEKETLFYASINYVL